MPTIYVLSKNKKNINMTVKFFYFLILVKKSLSIAWACFSNERYFSPYSKALDCYLSIIPAEGSLHRKGTSYPGTGYCQYLKNVNFY